MEHGIVTLLRQLGLEVEEAKIYLVMLELGPHSILTISSTADMQRTLVYRVIKRLITKGLIETITEGKKQKFLAKKPSALYDLIQRKKEQLHVEENAFTQSYPILQALYASSKTKNLVTLYKGFEGCKELFSSLVNFLPKRHGSFSILAGSNEIDILDFCYHHGRPFFSKRKELQLTPKVLSSSYPRFLPSFYQLDHLPFEQVKHLDNCSFNVLTYYFETVVANFFITNDVFSATLIQEPALVNQHQQVFNLIYDQASAR